MCNSNESGTNRTARSCDLTPCDFPVSDLMTSNVFHQKPRDLEHPRAVIETEFDKVDGTKNLCATIVYSIPERCQRCIEQSDRHFEQML